MIASAHERHPLTVSTLHRHKNPDRLMEAVRYFRSAHPEFRLVLAGLRGFAATELESLRRNLDLEEYVTFTGWIPRDALYDLYERADAYVAPSRFKGFGMPVLEALAAGSPAACSEIPRLTQITGTAAAHFDPDSTAAITTAPALITTDAVFRARATTAGPERARCFDWNRTAEQTLEQIEKLAP